MIPEEEIELEYEQFVQAESRAHKIAELIDAQRDTLNAQRIVIARQRERLRNLFLFIGAELFLFALLYLMPKLPY